MTPANNLLRAWQQMPQKSWESGHSQTNRKRNPVIRGEMAEFVMAHQHLSGKKVAELFQERFGRSITFACIYRFWADQGGRPRVAPVLKVTPEGSEFLRSLQGKPTAEVRQLYHQQYGVRISEACVYYHWRRPR